MPDGMLKPEEFEAIDDHERKTNIMYRLVYELYRRRKRDNVTETAKAMFGGFWGAIVFMAARTVFWK
jgi:hypothetical protein